MTADTVRDNLERVRERLAAACARAQRPPAAVRLVAVSKRVPLERVLAACAAGQWDLGENRIPDALDRQALLAAALAAAGLDPQRVSWHFVGHLQANKAARAAGRFQLLHGVDSLKLAERLDRLAGEQGRREPVLLEVNCSGEASKHGLDPAAAVAAVCRAAALPHLQVLGLMGMARYGAPEVELRATFARLRGLAEAARTASGLPMPELSMGMSDDFEAAVAEGATLVRIGTAIFGPRP